MQLNPYGRDAVHLAVDLANDPPGALPDLVQRCRDHGLVIDMQVDDSDLAATLSLIDRWRHLVGTGNDHERAKVLNRLLAEGATHPRLTSHSGQGWHLHYRDENVPLAQVLHALISVGTALHLAGRGMDRIGRCDLRECTNVYADTSRTGRQRYCSTRCANRDAVRRHRARQQG